MVGRESFAGPGDASRYRNQSMQFSIRSLLTMTTVVAILLAAFLYRPVLAVFLAAFVPFIVFIACRNKIRNKSLRLTMLFSALIPVYLASYGPSFLLNSYVMYTDPPSTKSEIDEHNERVKFQSLAFAPMNLNRMSRSALSRWRHEYLNGWMELSDELIADLVGYENDTLEQ